MPGRKTKYTPELVKELIELLEQGNTDTDSCALVGISTETFYTWIKEKPDFSDAVTHARSKARRAAVASWRQGMLPSATVIDEVTTYTETRLRKDADGNEVPYEYVKRTVTKKTVNNPADWRAAEAYLKRRDPGNWSETTKNINLNKDVSQLTDEELDEELKRYGLA